MHKRTPLFHIVKRKALPWYQIWAIRGAAIVLALLVCAVVTTGLTGENPINVFKAMFTGAFGTPRKTWVLGQNLAILLCVGKFQCFGLYRVEELGEPLRTVIVAAMAGV